MYGRMFHIIFRCHKTFVTLKFYIEVNIFKLGVFNYKYMLNLFSGLEV